MKQSKHSFFLFLLVFGIATHYVFGQEKLFGVVTNGITNTPLSNIEIRIVDGDRTITDSNGNYFLRLENCNSCQSGYASVYFYNDAIGFHSERVPLRSNGDTEKHIRVNPNPNKIGYNGIVKNNLTKEPLEGIKIQVIDRSLALPTQISDEFGLFYFELNKRNLPNIPNLRIQLKDSTDQCNYRDNVILYPGAPAEILLDCPIALNVISKEEIGTILLKWGHESANFLGITIIEIGRDYLIAKIFYTYPITPQTILLNLSEPDECWATVRFNIVNYNRLERIQPEVIQQHPDVKWSWRLHSFSDETVINYIRNNQ